MTLTPADLQRLIASDPRARGRVIRWTWSHGMKYREISGATLAAVCGVSGRTWRRWVGGDQPMPPAAWRLLVEVSGVDVGGQTEAA